MKSADNFFDKHRTMAGMHLDELRVRCYGALDQRALARLQRKGVCA